MATVRFTHSSTLEEFNKKKVSMDDLNTTYSIGGGDVVNGDPDIRWQDIVFIKDAKLIFTHGQMYDCSENATNLVGDTEIVNDRMSRPSGGITDISWETAQLESIKGNSITWCQLAKGGDNWKSTLNGSVTLFKDTGIYNLTNKNTFKSIYAQQYVTYKNNHVYLLTGEVKNLEGCDFSRLKFVVNDEAIYSKNNVSGKTWKKTSVIHKITNYVADEREDFNRIDVEILGNENSDSFSAQFRNICLYDLTLIYGNGNEPTTVEEFEEDYKRWFGRGLGKEDYNEGSLKSVRLEGIKTVGFNLVNVTDFKGTTSEWYGNELVEWDNSYDYDGQIMITYDFLETNIEASIYNSTFAGYQFKYTDGTESMARPRQTNSEKVHLSFISDQGKKVSKIVRYYGYNGDIEISNVCFNFVWSGKRNGEYEDYWEETESIPITSLTDETGDLIFPDGLKKVGDTYDEIYVEKGVTKAIKRIGSLDLGSLDWEYEQFSNTNIPIFHSVEHSDELGIKWGSKSLTSRYTHAPWSELIDKITDKRIRCYATNIENYGNVMIKDFDFTDAKSFKNSLKGQILYFELAEPEEYVVSNFSFPVSYRIDDFGTETFISPEDGISPIVTGRYGINAVDTLRRLPVNYLSIQSVDKFIETINKTTSCNIQKIWDPVSSCWTFTNDEIKNPLGGVVEVDSIFSFRRTAGNLSVAESAGGDRGEITGLKGNAFVWNQLANPKEVTILSNKIESHTLIDGYKVRGIYTGEDQIVRIGVMYQDIPIYNGHKYYIRATRKTTNTERVTTWRVTLCVEDTLRYDSTKSISTEQNYLSDIVTVTKTKTGIGRMDVEETYSEEIDYQLWKNGATLEVTLNAIDLTQMYGWGNEPDLETFESFLSTYYPFTYYPYCPAKVVSFNPTGIKTTGPNLIQNYGFFLNTYSETASSGVDGITVTFKSAKTFNGPVEAIRCGHAFSNSGNPLPPDYRASAIPVVPGQSYICHSSNPTCYCLLSFYDSQFVVVPVSEDNPKAGFTTEFPAVAPKNAAYATIQLWTRDITPDKEHSSQVSFTLAPVDGDVFVSPWAQTKDLDITKLEGTDPNGNREVIFPDGLLKVGNYADEIIGNKAIKRIAKLENLTWRNWVYEDEPTDFFTSGFLAHTYLGAIEGRNTVTLCSVYPSTKNDLSRPYISVQENYDQIPDSDSFYQVNGLVIWDPSLNHDTSALEEKLKDVPIYVIHETPKVYTINPLNISYRVSDYGTEMILPWSNTIETAPFVGTIKYGIDILGTLETMPSDYVSTTYPQYLTDEQKKQVRLNLGITTVNEWVGTQSEYDEILTKDPACTYYIVEG